MKSMSWLSFGHTLEIITAVIGAYVLANYVDKATFGQYQFILTVLGVAAIFTLRGSYENIVRHTVRAQYGGLLPNSYRFLWYTIPISLGLLSMAGYYFWQNNLILGYSILILAFAFPIFKTALLYDAVWVGRKRFDRKVILKNVQVIIPTICTVLTALIAPTVLNLVLTYFISHTTISLCLFLITLRTDRLTEIQSKSETLSNHVSVNFILQDLSKIIDRVIVFNLLGAVALATYMIALLPVRELTRIQQILRTITLPKFSQYKYEQVLPAVGTKTILVFITLLGIAGVYALAAPHLFSLLFPEYPDAILMTQILVLQLPFAATFVFVQCLTIFEKTTYLYITNLSTAVVKITALIILIYSLGIWGAIIANLISNVFRSTLLLLMYLRERRQVSD